MFMRKTVLSALLALVFAVPASALEIGQLAPAINIASWVKGDKFSMKEARGKNIVVVEFWATWCGPCKKSIPHLTDLQLRYKNDGVIILGISDEPAAKVRPFVTKQAQDMDYTIATDRERMTWAAYCAPFNVRGIPHAFIVDREGRLYWHGNPLDKEFDEKLAKVVKDQPMKVDEKLKKAEKHAKKYFRLAADKGANKDDLERAADGFFENASHDAKTLVDFGTRLMSDKDLKHKDLDLLNKVAKTAVDLTNGENWKASEIYAFALYQKKDYKGSLRQLKNALDWCTDFDAEGKIESRIERLERKIDG